MVVLGNCRESESDKAIDYSEEFDCFYFPPSPTYFPPSPTTFPTSPSYFPLYSPPSPPRPSSSNSSVKYVWSAVVLCLPQNDWDEDIVDLTDFDLAVIVEHKIQDRGGALDVIPSGRLVNINDSVQRLQDFVDSEAKNKALEYVDEEYRLTTRLHQESKPLEKQNEDTIRQLVIDLLDVIWFLIQHGDGALDIEPGVVSRLNGSEISDGQLLTSTPEPALIFHTKLSPRLWLGHRGQWVADFCYWWNWLNIDTFKIAEGAPFLSESLLRFWLWMYLFNYPFFDFFVNENRAEPTTKPRTEIQTLEWSPTEEQANPYEDFELGCSEATGSYGVEAGATRNDGIEAVGIGGCNGCDGTPIQVIHSTLLVDQEEIPLLNSNTLPSDQALAATIDTNSVLVMEIPPPLVLSTARQENLDEDLGNDDVDAAGIGGDQRTKEGEIDEAQFNSGAFGKRKRKEKTPRGERGNKKTSPVRNVIPLENILQVKKMRLTDAADHLKVSPSALKRACRENCIKRWPPRDIHKTPAVVDEEESAPLTSDTLLSDQALMAAIDINSVAEETTLQQFLPIVRQDKPDKDSSNGEVEEVGMGGVGTGEVEMRKNEKASGGERGGVRIKIPLEEILTYSHMCIEDAAMELKVSRSTLKRICRDYNISRWPPRDEHKHISQSRPNESRAIVDQERIPRLNSNMRLPANQFSATIDNTQCVTVRANYQDIRIKFRLSLPWRMAELEQAVKKRLQLEAGTYYIKYKDEDDGLTLIACDEDLKDCISSSSLLGTHSIEVFLSQKIAHEVRVDQL